MKTVVESVETVVETVETGVLTSQLPLFLLLLYEADFLHYPWVCLLPLPRRGSRLPLRLSLHLRHLARCWEAWEDRRYRIRDIFDRHKHVPKKRIGCVTNKKRTKT